MKRIGILTGGGDAPGLNAVIRAAVKTAILQYGCEVYGVLDGYDGFLKDEGIIPLGLKDVSGILPRGGTILRRGESRQSFCSQDHARWQRGHH